jgi:hypothetical protein
MQHRISLSDLEIVLCKEVILAFLKRRELSSVVLYCGCAVKMGCVANSKDALSLLKVLGFRDN